MEVQPGDGVLVPAGTAHALGEGVFVAEVQEPTDFSIVLEWSVTTSGREDSHLGLGFDTVMPAVDHARMTPERLASLRCHTDPAATGVEPLSALPAEADPFFRIDVWAPAASRPRRCRRASPSSWCSRATARWSARAAPSR